MKTITALVIGYRAGLIQALEHLNIPYALWHHKLLRRQTSTLQLVIHEYPQSKVEIENILTQFDHPFTHVIAGNEASVIAASYARSLFNCRQSNHSTVVNCHDKLMMKNTLRQFDIPMTDYMHYSKELSASSLVQHLGLPVVVKARHQSGGRGNKYIYDPDRLSFYFDSNNYFEKFILADPNTKVVPISPAEASIESYINHGKILFINCTQYFKKGHINLVPGQLSSHWQTQLLHLNQKIIEALEIEWGLTHIEFYLTPSGPLFGEIALRPPGGYIMELMSMAYQFNAWEAFVAMECDLPFTFPNACARWTSVNVLHPGVGRIKNIVGLDKIKTLASFNKIKLKVNINDFIKERIGVGEDVGYLLLSHADKQQLFDDTKLAERELKIQF